MINTIKSFGYIKKYYSRGDIQVISLVQIIAST